MLCAYEQDVPQALRASSAAWLPCAMRGGLSPISMMSDYNANARDALHAFSCYGAGLGLRVLFSCFNLCVCLNSSGFPFVMYTTC